MISGLIGCNFVVFYRNLRHFDLSFLDSFLSSSEDNLDLEEVWETDDRKFFKCIEEEIDH